MPLPLSHPFLASDRTSRDSSVVICGMWPMGFVEQQPKIGKEDAEDKDDASSSADDWPVLVLVPVLVLMVDRSLLFVHSFMEYD